jgi:hypothetical protein
MVVDVCERGICVALQRYVGETTKTKQEENKEQKAIKGGVPEEESVCRSCLLYPAVDLTLLPAKASLAHQRHKRQRERKEEQVNEYKVKHALQPES